MMRPSFLALVGLIASASPAAAADTRIERLAGQRIMAEMRCVSAPRPVSLVRWLLRNGLVRSVGPGADGIATLVPTRPLALLGRRILYLEAWGTERTASGRWDAPWPFAMSAGMHMEFIAVMLQGPHQLVAPIARRRLPRAWVHGDHTSHFMQVTEVICANGHQAD
jgi:hypothetical protein